MMVRQRRQVNCGVAPARALPSGAMGRMVVNQGLRHREKLFAGAFIGGRLRFGFRLRSRCAVVPPSLASISKPVVAKLGPACATRVPGALGLAIARCRR